MICSSLNRLFLTTPPLALAGHRKWRSHISAGLVFGEQVTPGYPRAVDMCEHVRHYVYMVDAYKLEGDKVTGTYQGFAVSGTVVKAAFNTCRSDVIAITIALDSSISVFGETREFVTVQCNVADGQPVKGWGDSSITEVKGGK